MISRKDVKQFVEWEEKPGSPVLSVYLDIDQSRAPNLNRGFEAVLRNQLRSLEQQLKSKKEKQEFNKDAKRVLHFVSRFEARGKTLVIFCDDSEDFFWHWEAKVPVANEAYWRRTPYVRPLLEALDEYERYGVILTDKAQARVFTVFLQEIEENREAFAEAEVRHIKTTGTDHRWSQLNIQRRADEHTRWHLKKVADLMGELAEKYGFDRLVLAGPTGLASELYTLLPKRLRQRVVDTVALAMDAKPHEVLQATLKIEEQVERASEKKLVQELVTAAAKNERAVTGLEPTIRAAQEGRIWRFLYAHHFAAGGSECRKCQVLFPDTQGSCPYCKESLSPVRDVVERLVEKVVNTGGRAEQVRGEAAGQLAGSGGVGAFLRF